MFLAGRPSGEKCARGGRQSRGPHWEAFLLGLGEPLYHEKEVVIVTQCCLFLLRRIKRNYCSLLEWQDSYSASRWGQVGVPNSLEEGCGEAAQAFCQGPPYSPPVGAPLLSAGATHWASSGHSVPMPSMPLPCLLPAAVLGLPLRLPPGWTHLVASNQDLRAPD